MWPGRWRKDQHKGHRRCCTTTEEVFLKTWPNHPNQTNPQTHRHVLVLTQKHGLFHFSVLVFPTSSAPGKILAAALLVVLLLLQIPPASCPPSLRAAGQNRRRRVRGRLRGHGPPNWQARCYQRSTTDQPETRWIAQAGIARASGTATIGRARARASLDRRVPTGRGHGLGPGIHAQRFGSHHPNTHISPPGNPPEELPMDASPRPLLPPRQAHPPL